MIKHIGIEVDKNDINDFYIKILKGQKKNSFIINENLAEKIFNIKKTVEVIHLQCEDVDLELFECSNDMIVLSFNHICLQRNNAKEIYHIAKANDYKAYLHKGQNNKETYFIKDTMNNIFEIKQS